MEQDSKAIPIREIRKAVEIMPYASTSRVMFQMLAYTGCRLAELDNMKWSMVKDGWLYWKLGKNQDSYRKIFLPVIYLRELVDYRESHKVNADKLFGMSSESFRRHFNRYIRAELGSAWLERSNVIKSGIFVTEYSFQLKGLRKTYQTLLFLQQLEKWKDPGVALQFTSKEMRHSSERITAYHYLVNFDNLGKSEELVSVEDLSSCPVQMRLSDFV